MARENSLRQSDIANSTDESRDEAPQAKSSRWFARKDREPDNSAADDADEQAENHDTPEPREHSDLFRAGKIDAYLRYSRMQPAPRTEEPVTLRRRPQFVERVAPRTHDDHDEERFYGYQASTTRRAPPRPARLSHHAKRANIVRDVAIAACLSLALGGLTALVVYDRTSNGPITQAVANLWNTKPSPAANTAKPAQVTVAEPQPVGSTSSQQQAMAVSKKPISIAQLDVQDVSGAASAMIPLSLRAGPAEPGQTLALRLSGLPENAYLTAGTRISETAWMLRPGEENGVKLVVPSPQGGQFAIAVEAIEPRTGDLAAPVKEITVNITPAVIAEAQPQRQQASDAQIEPANAAPAFNRNFNQPQANSDIGKSQPDAASPIPAPLEKTASLQSEVATGLVRSGDKLMTLGDFTAARQFYSKALDQGLPEAALKLGQTYDPQIFEEKNVQGLKPDASMAMKYYLQAQASGVTEAGESVSKLEAFMQR